MSTTDQQQRRTAVVAARLERGLVDQLRAEAKRLQLTPSTAIERAVRLWVEQRGGAG